MESTGPQRINKILSSAGVASRRHADEMVAEGRVEINGRPVLEPGTSAVWGEDRILVDGKEIPGPKARIYLMLNKPFGILSALSDPQGRSVVTDLIHGVDERVYPVGRLDFDSLGLLLLTNDGEWAYRMTHPRYHVPRSYKVTLEGELQEGDVERLRRGLILEDGFSGPANVTVLSKRAGRSILRMTIHIGRSRIVRRMIQGVGFPVIQLVRIGFGPLVLGDLKMGSYRHLTQAEVDSTKKSLGLT